MGVGCAWAVKRRALIRSFLRRACAAACAFPALNSACRAAVPALQVATLATCEASLAAGSTLAAVAEFGGEDCVEVVSRCLWRLPVVD